jgi:hypothetical protein
LRHFAANEYDGAHGLSRHSHATAEVTRPAFRLWLTFTAPDQLGDLLHHLARDSSNTERRIADATVARQDHRRAEQGLALPIRVGNGKQQKEKSSFWRVFVQHCRKNRNSGYET